VARRRRHRREFKLAALARLEGTSDVAALAAELGIDRGLLYKWSRAFRIGGAAALRLPGERSAVVGAGVGSPLSLAGCDDRGPAGSSILAGVGDLERKIVQQALELDFFRAALQHFAGRRRPSGGSGGTGSTL